jgi:hypothetical protein
VAETPSQITAMEKNCVKMRRSRICGRRTTPNVQEAKAKTTNAEDVPDDGLVSLSASPTSGAIDRMSLPERKISG